MAAEYGSLVDTSNCRLGGGWRAQPVAIATRRSAGVQASGPWSLVPGPWSLVPGPGPSRQDQASGSLPTTLRREASASGQRRPRSRRRPPTGTATSGGPAGCRLPAASPRGRPDVGDAELHVADRHRADPHSPNRCRRPRRSPPRRSRAGSPPHRVPAPRRPPRAGPPPQATARCSARRCRSSPPASPRRSARPPPGTRRRATQRQPLVRERPGHPTAIRSDVQPDPAATTVDVEVVARPARPTRAARPPAARASPARPAARAPAGSPGRSCGRRAGSAGTTTWATTHGRAADAHGCWSGGSDRAGETERRGDLVGVDQRALGAGIDQHRRRCGRRGPPSTAMKSSASPPSQAGPARWSPHAGRVCGAGAAQRRQLQQGEQQHPHARSTCVRPGAMRAARHLRCVTRACVVPSHGRGQRQRQRQQRQRAVSKCGTPFRRHTPHFLPGPSPSGAPSQAVAPRSAARPRAPARRAPGRVRAAGERGQDRSACRGRTARPAPRSPPPERRARSAP